MISLNFGYLPIPFDVDTGQIKIYCKKNIDEIKAQIIENPQVYKCWFYAPRRQGIDARETPVPSRIFGLPMTHSIHLTGSNDIARAKFILWALSLFLGMRLTSEERGFLDATPITPHKLIDASLRPSNYPNAVKCADDFYLKHKTQKNQVSLVESAIHTYLLAQCITALPFERFSYLYASLDTLFCYRRKATEPENTGKHLTHAGRIDWLCNEYNLTTPTWAFPAKKENIKGKTTDVSNLRNNAFHEGLFNGEPLGFRVLDGSSPANIDNRVIFEMRKLTSRLLIAAITNPSVDYVQSPINSRLRQVLSLP